MAAAPLLDAPRPCRRHPGDLANLSCTFCHDPLCSRCAGTFEERPYCEACLVAVYARERAAEEAPPPQGRSGLRTGVIVMAGVFALAGTSWLLVRGPYRRAGERAVWKECEVGLERVHAAALLYAADHGGRLPAAPDLRSESLVDALLADGYLHHRPKVTSPGTIFRPDLRTDADPSTPYVVDDAPHGDGKRHMLYVEGRVKSMAEVDIAKELARAATLTAAPAAATPTPVSPTSISGGGR